MSDADKAGAEPAFGVLGPLEASYAGAALPLGGGRQRAVLALLVCEAGHAVSVERLLQGLWGESVPPGAVTSVQTYVFHLRQVLEPGRARGSPGSILVTVPGGYRLDVDRLSVDAGRFEDLVAAGAAATKRLEPERAAAAYGEALSLWRGDVLADLADYDFVAPYRARLEELRATAQQNRIQAELDLGNHAAVLAELRVLLSENPLREGLHAQRILALYRSGRQSDALAAYRELRSVLDTELGIEPSPPLHELNTRVLIQDPGLNWTPPARTAGAPLSTTSPDSIVGHAPPTDSYLREGHRRRLPALAVVTAAVAVLAGGAGLPVVEAPSAAASAPPNSVVELDASGRVLASVPVGTNPIAVASTPGALWVVNASDDSVWKINPATHAVEQKIAVGQEPRAIASTGDDLWVTNFADNTVSRINVEDGTVSDLVDVGSGPYAIAAGPAGLWVANSGANTIQRIVPDQHTPETAIPVDDGPDGLAVDDDSVWVANGRAGTVWRVDARTGHPTWTSSSVGSGPRGIVRLGDYVWVTDESDRNVFRIRISSGHADSVEVGDGPTALVAFAGSVWASVEYSGELVRIDPDNMALERVEVGAAVHGLAVADGRLWVAAGALPSTKHIGGTLRVAAADLPGRFGTIDPAGIYDLTSHLAMRMVYDGLLAYHYSSADPQVIVPDLATTVPKPTDDGRTYVFNLRPGIRYSNGVELHASDFVLGVERTLMHGPRPDFYAGILGGRECATHHASCDLSQGVVPDDAAGSVTFHLEAPDPQFLFKLTLLVVPMPPGTPLRKITSPPLPGTGPYQIATYHRGAELTLTRNPHFETWSTPAQPAGFANVVTWVPVADTRAAAEAVQEGQADLAELTPLNANGRSPGALVEDLLRTDPKHVFGGPIQGTNFGVLNSSKLPFSKVSARRAINYAVDRRTAVELLGGGSVNQLTCQLIPPNVPSYHPYCPYSAKSENGDYAGPDMVKAARLVARSGTYGMRVVVTDVLEDYNPGLEDYLAQVLRKLGYVATVDRRPRNQANSNDFYDQDSGIQVETGGWIADFPLPSNFFEIVNCADPHHNYVFGYCDHELADRAAAANALLRTDPVKALEAWTSIDDEVTDRALLLPVSNGIDSWLTSKRVGNYQTGAENIGPLLSQLWVQ